MRQVPKWTTSVGSWVSRQARSITGAANISIPPVSQIKLDFWTLWGGKIVLALLILLYAAYSMWPSNREQQSEGDA
jgi:hypothetical protein